MPHAVTSAAAMAMQVIDQCQARAKNLGREWSRPCGECSGEPSPCFLAEKDPELVVIATSGPPWAEYVSMRGQMAAF